MTGKTAVERIGSAIVATYVQIESKEPKGRQRGKLTPEITPYHAKFPGKSSGFCLWKWGGFPVMEIGVQLCY
jgi:hypothetical protein